ncbi:MAG: DNRLRE domain-containing protein [Opitutus sp.]
MKLKALLLLLPLLTLVPHVAQARSLTRGPYLQNGSTSATTVRWRTSTSTDSVVRYGTTAGSLNLTASDATSTTEHEVRLTGLSPNTKYFYSIGYGSTTLASGTDHFVLTAPTGAKPTRIWALGDAGTGSAVQTAVRDAYYTYTGAVHTDLWLMLGDNAYSTGTDAEYSAKMYAIYPAMFRKSVLWTTIGNHDAGSADSPTQTGPYYDNATLPKQGEAGGVASGTEAYYSFDYGNIHFVCLDSMDTSRSATGAMANWLTSDLQNNTKDWLVVFFHHPPYTKGSHDSDTESNLVEMRQNFGPILENYGTDLVLSGHSHSYERSKFIDGHYGLSGTFSNATMVVQTGSGQGAGAYTKTTVGPLSHSGTVYAVPGASGQISGGTLNHPAMYVSLNVAGSMVLDVNGSTLNATYLDSAGIVRDSFTITKSSGPGNVLPTVSITSPAAGATFNAPASITIDATAADSDGTVTQVAFYQGASLLGTDTTSPYSFTWSGVAAGSYSLTAKATDNVGGIQTSTAIPVTVNSVGGPTTVSFQQGTNGYAGMIDTHIRSDATTTNYGGATTLLIDGKPDYSALLRWDLSAIPAGKTVTAVTLTFNVVTPSSHVYELYALRRDWSESEATWAKATSAVNWTTAGASSSTGDREPTVLGTVTSTTTGSRTITLNGSGVAKVQSWINSPSTNFGFVVQDYTVTKGIDLTSSEGGNVSQRPIITVTYQ